MKKITVMFLAFMLLFSGVCLADKAIFDIKFGDTPEEVREKADNNIKIITGDQFRIITGTEIKKVDFFYRDNKLYKVKRIKEITENATKEQLDYILENRLNALEFMNGEPDENNDNIYRWNLETETITLKLKDNKIITINQKG